MNTESNPRTRPGRAPSTLRAAIIMAMVLPTGCITGHEAEESMEHDKSAELEEARTLEEIGAISETTYELKKERIESEE